MRVGMEIGGMESALKRRTAGGTSRRLAQGSYAQATRGSNAAWMAADSRILQMDEKSRKGQDGGSEGTDGENAEGDEGKKVRSEAEKIYQAVAAGQENPIKSLRQKPKVPYEHLAKDGIIEYNGVCFVCDEETNSICLGDMTDEKNVLTITLSGGGHLKVNRNNIGDLSRAAGMFSPEDLNLILRAIAKDTQIQSVKKEIEDTEASVGNRISPDRQGDDAGTKSKEDHEA